jgi:hypothetical protein
MSTQEDRFSSSRNFDPQNCLDKFLMLGDLTLEAGKMTRSYSFSVVYGETRVIANFCRTPLTSQ